MIDILFTLGQAVCAVLFFYGAYLAIDHRTLRGRGEGQGMDNTLDDGVLLRWHLHNDA